MDDEEAPKPCRKKADKSAKKKRASKAEKAEFSSSSDESVVETSNDYFVDYLIVALKPLRGAKDVDWVEPRKIDSFKAIVAATYASQWYHQIV